tara:strand:+ start:1139 stop:2209 length:1071 start_codon:yes stop_codon:yes gene_type:complete
MSVINRSTIDQNSDVTTTTTLLHEVIPMTGSIMSGVYGPYPDGTNIKTYTHGMFESVYDYPYLSSSANHILDLTIGYDETSPLNNAGAVQNTKKQNLYNQFAQLLLGYTSSTTDSLRTFQSALNVGSSPNTTINEAFFLSFSRLLTKDQIKRGSFSVSLGTGSWSDPFGSGGSKTITLSDLSASYGPESQVGTSNGGEYGVLYDAAAPGGSSEKARGLIFYQAGIAVITCSVFNGEFGEAASDTVAKVMSGSAITGSTSILRHRINNISYNNTTEINSSIYFCRIPHNEYNYSSNPTYLSGSKIRVKNTATDSPVSYITTVGLYNSIGELLAVAKLSEPLRKDPTNDITIRVRLDY